MGFVRAPAVAGMFYPADGAELRAAVRAYLAQAQSLANWPAPKAIIAPHAGYIYSGPVAASVYAQFAPLKGKVTRIVLMGPSHRVAFRGLAVSDASSYRTPLGDIPIDGEAQAALLKLQGVDVFDPAHIEEHSLEVHLPFLQEVLGEFALVPIVAGDASAQIVARALDLLWGGEETRIVISTDLSHYLSYDAARARDTQTCAAIESLNPGALASDQACGRVPVRGLLTLARAKHLSVRTLDIRNSGDTAGPKDRVVGYGAWAFYESAASMDDDSIDPELAERLLQLASLAIRQGLKTKKPPKAPALTPNDALAAPGAAFVTLKKNGQLRGCIGSAQAWRPLGADIAENAFNAAFSDPRFAPLSESELWETDLSISLLTAPEPFPIADEADLLRKLTPGKDGLIIEGDGKRALFLPSVWEQLPEPRSFLAHLKQKAGLSPEQPCPGLKAWRFFAKSCARNAPKAWADEA